MLPDVARFADRWASGVSAVVTGPAALAALDGDGFWAVVASFEGEVTAVRFEHVIRARQDGGSALRPTDTAPPTWAPLEGPWETSLGHEAYLQAVADARERIAAGVIYQANICRVLRHPLDAEADLDGLETVVGQGNPAPYAARLRVADAGLDLVCASPELWLGRSGTRLVSSPIKGTAATPEAMLAKDYAENVMIVDLVRNDLSHVCRADTVDVEILCAPQAHPGLVHLVSTVAGELRPDVTWADIFGATFPPGSVSGAPKSSALTTIADLETRPRGPYCGAIGWVDASRGEAQLAVGIRTFWAEHDLEGSRWLAFGTGAGITWGSDPEGEWAETQLKASRLVGLASGALLAAYR